MNKKAELEMKTIVVIIIAIFTLMIILGYVFFVQGGPASLIESLLGFLNGTTDYVQATAP